MKRRDFIKVSSLMLGGLPFSRRSYAETPCQPSGFGVEGGSSGPTPPCPLPEGEGPNWVDSLGLNQWTALQNTNVFRDVWAPDTGQYGNTGPQSVMIAWCGAVYASGQGASGSLIHWGGGHQDYYGNELYAFDLNTLTWGRLNDPSPHATTANINAGLADGLYPDGTPGAPHTYAGVIYRSATNEFVTTRRELNNIGGYTTIRPSSFDLSRGTWTNYADAMSPSSRYNLCVYDYTRDVIWAVNTHHADSLSWSKFDFSSGNWTNYTEPSGVLLGSAAVHVPTKDCVVFWSNNGSSPYALDPKAPSGEKIELAVSGETFNTSTASADSAHWSDNLGAIVYYPSRSSSIYIITPPSGDWKTGSWTSVRVNTSGSSGSHSGNNGTFGKFQVAEWGGSTVCLLNANISGPCYAVRLS